MVKNLITTPEEDKEKNLNNTQENLSFFEKIKKILTVKNIKIIVFALIGVVAIILCVGFTSNSDDGVTKETNYISTYMTTIEYCDILENKLEKVLSQINGAGNVKVMISVSGSPELVYASDIDEKTSSTTSGTTTTTSSSPIIVDGSYSALILTENLPEVKGVIVVSSGAKNVSVKLDILNAVSTLLDISNDKVSVLNGI